MVLNLEAIKALISLQLYTNIVKLLINRIFQKYIDEKTVNYRDKLLLMMQINLSRKFEKKNTSGLRQLFLVYIWN